MFRGRSDATIDAKGRLKIPSRFRDILREKFDGQLYITCLSSQGEYARVYPMPIWEGIERQFSTLPPMDEAAEAFEDAFSYYGFEYRLDNDGRILIPPFLRKSAQLESSAEVIVLGKTLYLEIWNHELFRARMAANPTNGENRRRLAQHPAWRIIQGGGSGEDGQ